MMDAVASFYRELAPPPALRETVACVWASHDGPVRVLPDACVDVVFSAGRLLVAGPATRAQLAAATPGHDRCGVRFRIGAAEAALGVPAAELLDEGVALAELWGSAGRRLEDRVARARQPLHALVGGLAPRLAGARPDPLVRAAAVALLHDGLTLDRAGHRVGLGERQLRRRFERAVGYGPATLVRVQRFQHFLRAAAVDPGASLARLAADAGYADQAHLARESRRLAGLPPSALLAAGAGPAGERTGSFKAPGPAAGTMAA
jgi:AraC-like DNA-binding protein